MKKRLKIYPFEMPILRNCRRILTFFWQSIDILMTFFSCVLAEQNGAEKHREVQELNKGSAGQGKNIAEERGKERAIYC